MIRFKSPGEGEFTIASGKELLTFATLTAKIDRVDPCTGPFVSHPICLLVDGILFTHQKLLQIIPESGFLMF